MIELTSFQTGTSTCDHTGTLTSVQTGTWISFQTATSWGTQIYLKFIVKMSCTWVIYALSTYRLWNLLPIGNLIFLFFCNLIKNSLSKILSYFFFLPCWNFFLNLCNKKNTSLKFCNSISFYDIRDLPHVVFWWLSNQEFWLHAKLELRRSSKRALEPSCARSSTLPNNFKNKSFYFQCCTFKIYRSYFIVPDNYQRKSW